MVDDGNFPIRVFFRDRASHHVEHPGFTLYSRHRSGASAERAYQQLVREMPNKDVELVDVRTGERKRYGSARWRRDHAWSEAFVLNEPACAEAEVLPSGFVDFDDGTRSMYGCLPCPACADDHRASYVRGGKRTVECDECGYVEPGKLVSESERRRKI